MFITAGITSLCEKELKIVRAAKICYAGRTLPTPGLYNNIQPANEFGFAITALSPTATKVVEFLLSPIITSTRIIRIQNETNST